STGPSGSTCHQRCPAAASQSTKRRACSSSTPFGKEAGCSRIPDDRTSLIRARIARPVPLPKTTTPPPRILIQAVEPVVDCGRYPLKRTVGERVDVYATILKDGHDVLRGAVRIKPPKGKAFDEPLGALGNDRFAGSFVVDQPGRYSFAIVA